MASSDEMVLRFAGVLGHSVVVVRGKDGERSAGFQTDNIRSARAYAAEQADKGNNPTIYRRAGKTWKRAE